MKWINLLFYGILTFAAMNVAECQEEYHIMSIGASLGQGYAIDFSYGKREKVSGEADRGADLLISLWTPNYGSPIPTDNTPEMTADDYYTGDLQGSKDYTLGTGIGARYAIKPFAVGGMFDLVLNHHFDHYRNPFDNSISHLRTDATLGGWTGTIAVVISDNLTADGYYGTRRGLNVGLAWNIINP